MAIKLMMLTADPNIAEMSEKAGIDRVFLDLEIINKIERQKGRNTVISHNSFDDIAKVRKVLHKTELLVRVNPINPNSQAEIDRAINDGADIIMIPMITDAKDVEQMVDMVRGRAKVCPLIETAQALARIDSILEVDGIDEIYVGLNDMHLSLGLDFMFEVVSDGLMDYLASKFIAKGLPFGFGGIARIGEGIIKSEYVIAEHYRMKSTSAILSRSFRNFDSGEIDLDTLTSEVNKIRDFEKKVSLWDEKKLINNKIEFIKLVHNFVDGGKK